MSISGDTVKSGNLVISSSGQNLVIYTIFADLQCFKAQCYQMIQIENHQTAKNYTEIVNSC